MALIPVLDIDPLRPPRKEGSSRLHVVRKPSTRVRQAVRDNNVPLLARLRYKMELRNMDKMRLTSLAWAALEGCVEVFEWLLLDYGHDDQELSRDVELNTVFHLLAASGAPPGVSPHWHLMTSSPEFPPRPVTRSPDAAVGDALRMAEVYYTLFPFLLDWSNNTGKTALHIAAQADNAPFIALFADLGADLDLVDLQGNTPLHYASAWGNVSAVRALLERGASVQSRNFEGFTAADYAYSHVVRAALDSIARDVLEERRARRKEERAREREREAVAPVYPGGIRVPDGGPHAGPGLCTHTGPHDYHERFARGRDRLDDGSSFVSAETSEARDRSRSRSQDRRGRSASLSTSASGHSIPSSSHSGPPRSPEPPLPPLPPAMAAAAAAATRARHLSLASQATGMSRASAGSGASGASGIGLMDPYSIHSPCTGSPTPVASRQVSDSSVPTITLPGDSPSPTTTPSTATSQVTSPTTSPARPRRARAPSSPTTSSARSVLTLAEPPARSSSQAALAMRRAHSAQSGQH